MAILVNSEKIEEDMLQQELQMLMERYRQELSPEEIESKRDQIQQDAKQNAIERIILIQQARREINDVDDDEVERQFEALIEKHGGLSKVQKQFSEQPGIEDKIRNRIIDGLKLEQYFEQVCGDVEAPGEDECREYYDLNTSKFEYPEMLRASHIVRQPVQGQNPAQLMTMMLNIREQVIKGTPFEDVANTQSQCDDDGGDLGWFPRGQMVPEFEEVVFGMEPGEVSDVFQTPFGYHIVKLFNRRPSGVREFEDVRYEIENMIIEAKKNDKIGEIVDQLREGCDIREVQDDKQIETE